MKHTDGIAVRLQNASGEQIKEYDNGPDIPPYSRFNGSHWTREIALGADTRVDVVVSIEESFKCYSADGLLIEISSGSPMGNLSLGDSGQYWWLDVNDPGTFTEHKFSFLTVWDDDELPGKTWPCQITMPAAHSGESSNASTPQALRQDSLPSESSLAVFVRRAKWNNAWRSPRMRTLTEPLEALRGMPVVGPKIVHGDWFRDLRGDNGLPAIFEFRNMGRDGVDLSQEEADEELGVLTFVEPDSSGVESSDEDNDVDDLECEQSDTDDKSSDDDFSDFQYSSMRANAIHRGIHRGEDRATRRERRAAKRETSDNARYDEQETTVFPPEKRKSKLVKLKACYHDAYPNVDVEDEDDEEELPNMKRSPAEHKPAVGPNADTHQETTPAPDHTRSLPRSTAGQKSNTSKSNNVGTRQTYETAITKFFANSSHVNRDPIPERPSDLPQTPEGQQKRRVDFDPTPYVDESVARAKPEVKDNIQPERQSRTSEALFEDDDEEDLEDQLQEVQIRRKLRALKKRKTASVLNTR